MHAGVTLIINYNPPMKAECVETPTQPMVQDWLDLQPGPPGTYAVLMLNDDYTPMEFVVEALMRFFGKDRKQATQLMLQVHHAGEAVCGLFTKDLAETKVMQVISWAREHEHPLLCRMKRLEGSE